MIFDKYYAMNYKLNKEVIVSNIVYYNLQFYLRYLQKYFGKITPQ